MESNDTLKSLHEAKNMLHIYIYMYVSMCAWVCLCAILKIPGSMVIWNITKPDKHRPSRDLLGWRSTSKGCGSKTWSDQTWLYVTNAVRTKNTRTRCCCYHEAADDYLYQCVHCWISHWFRSWSFWRRWCIEAPWHPKTRHLTWSTTQKVNTGP